MEERTLFLREQIRVQIPKTKKPQMGLLNGGGIGIRTLGTLARTTVFKTAPINHSGIPPRIVFWSLIYVTQKKNNCKGVKE